MEKTRRIEYKHSHPWTQKQTADFWKLNKSTTLVQMLGNGQGWHQVRTSPISRLGPMCLRTKLKSGWGEEDRKQQATARSEGPFYTTMTIGLGMAEKSA